MIEIQNVVPLNKNSVLCTVDVHIKPWHMILKEVVVFQKGASRWVGMPSRTYEKDGEKRYVELVQFDSDSIKKRFRDQIMSAVDKYLANNPDMTPEPVVKEEDLPF